MAKPWDATMKKLIRDNPQAFIQWFVPNATYVKERINELENVQPEMDVINNGSSGGFAQCTTFYERHPFIRKF